MYAFLTYGHSLLKHPFLFSMGKSYHCLWCRNIHVCLSCFSIVTNIIYNFHGLHIRNNLVFISNSNANCLYEEQSFIQGCFIYFHFCILKPLRMHPLPPTPHLGRRGTVINYRRPSPDRHGTAPVRFTLRRGCYSSSSWFKVQSEISDVPAIHTIEMIPKSMILVNLMRSQTNINSVTIYYQSYH